MNIRTENTRRDEVTLGMKGLLDRINNTNKSPGYKCYKERLIFNLKRFGFYEDYLDLRDFDKYMIYEFRMVIKDPVAASGHVIEKRQLRSFGKILRSEMRKENILFGDKKISIYDISQMLAFFMVYSDIVDKEIVFDEAKRQENEKVKELPSILFKLINSLLLRMMYNYFASISNITKEIYYFTLTSSKLEEYGMSLFVIPTLRLVYQKMYHVNINNIKRPVFRTPYICLQSGSEWNNIDSSLLGKDYKGDHKKLYLYIQSHALNRISERIDIYENNYSNSLIWDNTESIKEVIKYKGNYLVPFKVKEIKIGYMLAEIVDEKFIITTFLLLTHFDTPEGDRFKEISGLGFADISYWKLDKLSTFRTFDSDKYPRIADYLERAGMGDILKLSKEHINTRELQSVDLKQLISYILKGRLSERLHEKEIKQKIEQVKKQWNN